MIQRPIILASKSPRRSHLMREAGFAFTVKTNEVAEDYPADMPAEEVAPYLAQKKARASRDFIKNDEIILAADSIVIQDNTIYEKPKDYEDAVRILTALSGKAHLVITGVCILDSEKELVFSGISKVHFEPLSQAEIAFYVKTYQPYDKAGAYAIQEWIGLCKIAKIEGTYSNIMGLPVDLVYRHLMDWG